MPKHEVRFDDGCRVTVECNCEAKVRNTVEQAMAAALRQGGIEPTAEEVGRRLAGFQGDIDPETGKKV